MLLFESIFHFVEHKKLDDKEHHKFCRDQYLSKNIFLIKLIRKCDFLILNFDQSINHNF